MGDAGVDLRQDAGLHHLAHVDAQRRAAEIQGRDGEVFVLAEGDLIHFKRGLDCQLRGAADKLDDGGRGCHGHPAVTGRLGDGAVADVGIGIFLAELREIQAPAPSRPAR